MEVTPRRPWQKSQRALQPQRAPTMAMDHHTHMDPHCAQPVRAAVLTQQSTRQPSSSSEALVFKGHVPRPRPYVHPPKATLPNLPLCRQLPCARLAPPGSPATSADEPRLPWDPICPLGGGDLSLRDRSQMVTVQMMKVTPTQPRPSWRYISRRPAPAPHIPPTPARSQQADPETAA